VALRSNSDTFLGLTSCSLLSRIALALDWCHCRRTAREAKLKRNVDKRSSREKSKNFGDGKKRRIHTPPALYSGLVRVYYLGLGEQTAKMRTVYSIDGRPQKSTQIDTGQYKVEVPLNTLYNLLFRLFPTYRIFIGPWSSASIYRRTLYGVL